jgi:hypothetical protein
VDTLLDSKRQELRVLLGPVRLHSLGQGHWGTLLARRAIFRGRVFFQRNEQLVIILSLGVSIFLGLCCDFGGRRWGFGDCRWCWRDFDSSSPSYEGCSQQDLSFSNGWNGCSTVSVRNVVPTLTSNERQGLSLNGRC